MGVEPGQRVFQEPDGALLLLVGHQRGVGQPRGIIDGDVEILPAQPLAAAAPAALAGAVASDAVADAIDTAELLDVDMNQLAGPLALIADDLAGRLEGGEPAEAEAAECDAD
jgi:hypothetical protein